MTTLEDYLRKVSLNHRPGSYMDNMVRALQAVSELHRRTVISGGICMECTQVTVADEDGDEQIARCYWPCPTIERVWDALGIDGKEDTK